MTEVCAKPTPRSQAGNQSGLSRGTASLWKPGLDPCQCPSSARLSSLLLGQPCGPLTSLPLAGSPVPGQDLSSDTLDTILARLWLRAPKWGFLLWCPGMPRFTSSSTAGSTDLAATPTATPRSCHHRAAPQRRSSVNPPAGQSSCKL